MVQAELEKNLIKDVDKLAQNGQKTSLISQLSDTVDVLDSVISELRLAQNGNAQENQSVSQLISSLTEIRGNTLRRNPVIVWQNPVILVSPQPKVEESPKTSASDFSHPHRRKVGRTIQPPTEEKKKLPTTSPEGFMSVAQICKTLGISGSAWY